MKDILRILVLLLLPFTVVAQQYDYAKLMGGVAGNGYAQGVVTDDAGNVYMKGSFSGSQEIDGVTHRTTGTESFIAKYNQFGNLIWYKNAGFDEAEDGTWQPGNIAIDNANNIYITGYFGGVQNIEGTILTSNGSTDIYVIKYDQNGNFIMAKSFGTPGFDAGLAITVDGTQNIYIGGFFETGNAITFNGVVFNTTTTFNTEFYAKLKADGSEDWMRVGVGEGGAYEDLDFSDATNSLFAVGVADSNPVYKSINADTGIDNWVRPAIGVGWFGSVNAIESFGDNLYITGYFYNGDIGFQTALGVLTLAQNAFSDIFLVRVDSTAGFANWGKSYGGSSNEEATDISINPATGEVYITGYYKSADLTLMGVAMPQASVNGSPFLAYADGSGNDVTAIGIQTTGYSTGTGLVVSPVAGTLYTAGFYDEFADFGTNAFNQKNDTYYLGSHKLSNLSNNWVESPLKGEVIVEYMVVDNNDNLFLGGYFDGTIDVMGKTIISSEITTDPLLPRNDLFVAKMKPDETIEWIVVAGGMDADTLRGITYDGQGSVYLNARFTNVATIAGVLPDVMGKVIVKLDQNGKLVYAYQVNLPPNSDITAIQGDNDIGADTLYIGGYYNGTAFFQGNPTNGSNLTDVFLVALDGNGTVIPSQVTSHGGEGVEIITDMHKLPGGQLHITGWSNSPNNLAFDGLDLPIGAANGTDIFVVRFDDTLFENGGFIDGGPEDQFATFITLDGLGNIIVAGDLEYEGTFSGTLLSFDNNYESYFIASYSDVFGTFNFANEIYEPLGGGVSGSLSDLNADGSGNIYLAGIMRFEDLFFDGTTSISTNGQTDGFLAKYDLSGNLDFAEAYGGNHINGAEQFKGFDHGLAMAVNSADELWYSGTLTLLAETFGSFTLQPASSVTPGQTGGMDSYLLRLGSGAAACASPPTANAGADVTWCSSGTGAVNGSRGGSATSSTWTTSGDGTFANSANLFTNYTLGANDLANGSVTLTLTTDDPDGAGPCLAASDDIIITIEAAHTADAGPDQTVCQGDPVILTGAIGGSALTARWSIQGVGDGSFDDIFSLNAIYAPGANDIINGSVTLLLETDPTSCTEESDATIITISQPIIAVGQVASLNVLETTVIDVTNGATIGPGDIITTTLLTQPQKGTTIINGDGSLSYTAMAGTVGDDTFDYEICNQCNLCSSAQIIITIINVPPVVNVPPSTIIVGGMVNINILADITDDNDNIDLSTLKILIQPSSGAPASLDASGNLTVDYAGLKFIGTDQLTIEICDLDGLCTSQVIFIEVEPPGVTVYNAVSPNGDGKHDFLEIENAEFFPDNQVKIMNRWGDIVFEITSYDNDTKKFIGVANKNGSGELPSGTYYYNIVLGDGSKDLTGFFTLRR